ncbi:chromosome segregation protein SMC, partial [Pseudomonas sp. MWU12-2534b]
RQQNAQQQRDELNREGLQARDELKVAEQALTITRQLLERQRLARSASVEELRGQLQDNQPCPVCGSHEHPYHQPEALLQSLGRHDESEEAAARQAVDTLTEKLNQLREKVGGLIAQQKELLTQQEQLAQQHQELAPSLQAHPLHSALLEQDGA